MDRNKKNYLDAKRMVNSLTTDIRNLYHKNVILSSFKKAGNSEIAAGFLDGKAIKRVIIFLKGLGCAWNLTEDGGCTMCGHLVGSTKGASLPLSYLKKQFNSEMQKYDFKEYPLLCLYNGGSFLNENEIAKEFRRYCFKKIAANPNIKKLIIESRPEFITEEILDEIEDILQGKEVEIGVGLESSNDGLRDLVINKGITSEEYVSLGQRMHKRKTKLLMYVLVKPPFLTEAEAIKDAITTTEFAFTIGADVVSLEPVSIQSMTIIDFLSKAGYYKTPWIWSVIKVVQETAKFGLVRIGGFEFYPIPKDFTSNCSLCNEMMINKINEYNTHHNLEVLENLSCVAKCDEMWMSVLNKETMLSLPDRIIYTLQSIDRKFIFDNMLVEYLGNNIA